MNSRYLNLISRTLPPATIIPAGKIKGSVRTVTISESEIDELVLAKSLIIYAVAGKAAEAVISGKGTSAAYKFLKNNEKTDFKIANASAEKLCPNPPMRNLLLWIKKSHKFHGIQSYFVIKSYIFID